MNSARPSTAHLQHLSLGPPPEGSVRLAVLSDLHVGGRGNRQWHGPLRYEDAPSLLAQAVHAATDANASALLVLGDLADRGDEASLRLVRNALAGFGGAVLAVAGNHDRALDNETFERVFASFAEDNVTALAEAHDLHGIVLTGVRINSVDGGLTCTGTLTTDSLPESLAIVLSHYPLLPVENQLAEAGLRDAGTLANATQALHLLGQRKTPTLVLNGHVHARLETHRGTALQLSVASLIEQPHELSIVDVNVTAQKVDVRRFSDRAAHSVASNSDPGPSHATSTKRPVLAPAQTGWSWSEAGWSRHHEPNANRDQETGGTTR